jgi:hypothetical protein
LPNHRNGETQIFIGDENPIKGISNCSMVVAPYQSSEGQGILAIIGPKRMDYAKNKSLIEYMKKASWFIASRAGHRVRTVHVIVMTEAEDGKVEVDERTLTEEEREEIRRREFELLKERMTKSS